MHSFKRFFSAALISLLIPVTTNAMFSNIIVFGDSLSDIGNFPESVTRLKPGTDEVSQHIYLPARNPVNLNQTNAYTVPGAPEVTLSYPEVNAQNYLPEQPPIDDAPRFFRAINWTQYLLHEAKLMQLTKEDDITPWITLYQRHKSPAASVNYAYYGALITNDCHDQDYGHPSECTRESIYQTQQAYREGPQDVVDMNSVQVPGFQKQIELFVDDLKQQKITVDDNTAFIIMIGGNDISFACKKLQSLNPRNMWDAIQHLSGGIANNVENALEQLLKTQKIHHVYVMNMYNLGLSPKVYHQSASRFIAEHLTQSYNKQLANRLKNIQARHPETHINLYDTYSQFAAQARSDLFKANVGRQCSENSEYLTSYGSPLNCNQDEAHNAYLFWNRAHPTSLVDQFLAHGLLQFMQTTWQT
ncbi:MAG: SGNH/GDSL hydrolase family protein [Legionellaceae bacterium]|nr:SGNH/GDSL hydrolase family protein [Legionellaceae bacterium]